MLFSHLFSSRYFPRWRKLVAKVQGTRENRYFPRLTLLLPLSYQTTASTFHSKVGWRFFNLFRIEFIWLSWNFLFLASTWVETELLYLFEWFCFLGYLFPRIGRDSGAGNRIYLRRQVPLFVSTKFKTLFKAFFEANEVNLQQSKEMQYKSKSKRC